MPSVSAHSVVCFGEVLWDILPSGAVPGGAPMNVAYHLHKLGKNPALITRIGKDNNGTELRNIFSKHGVCTDYFQVDEKHETGKVFAKPNEDNEVVYDIIKPVAWDFIEHENQIVNLVEHAGYFVFGSLASRSSTSKKTLFSLLEAAKSKVLDINLRAPHYNRKIVQELLVKADFLKLNLAELELITGWFSDYSSIDERIKSLSDRFQLSNIVITKGGDGATLYMDGETINHAGIKIDVVDTVGSGDAFLAGLLSKIIEGKTHSEALEYASGLGALIATKRGACPEYEINEVYKLINKQNTEV